MSEKINISLMTNEKSMDDLNPKLLKIESEDSDEEEPFTTEMTEEREKIAMDFLNALNDGFLENEKAKEKSPAAVAYENKDFAPYSSSEEREKDVEQKKEDAVEYFDEIIDEIKSNIFSEIDKLREKFINQLEEDADYFDENDFTVLADTYAEELKYKTF